MKNCSIYIFVFIINVVNAIFIINDEKECLSLMDYFLNKILPILISVVLTGIITYLFSAKQARKSQIIKNTEEIQKLARQLGVNDEKTFHAEFSEQYNTILDEFKNSIGKTANDKALTGQHNDILKIIEKDFEKINNRYKKEDESYLSFTSQQKDLKEALDNFSKDYTEVISLNKRLNDENIYLKHENSILLKRNHELKAKLSRYETKSTNQSLHI